MATPAQVAELRLLINDSHEPHTFDNAFLSAQLDAAGGDVRATAGTVWGIRASQLAGLVDTTEGSSSRKLSQLYQQALTMASFYGGEQATSGGSTPTRSRTRAIVRPE